MPLTPECIVLLCLLRPVQLFIRIGRLRRAGEGTRLRSPSWLEAAPRPDPRTTTALWGCLPGCQITLSSSSSLSAGPQGRCELWETPGWSWGPGSELVLPGSFSSPSSLTLTFHSPFGQDTSLLSDSSGPARKVLLSWFKLCLKPIHTHVWICMFRPLLSKPLLGKKCME